MIVTTRPQSSESEMCSSNEGPNGGGGDSEPGSAGTVAAPASARGRSTALISASSARVMPRTSRPQSGTSASPTALAANASGRLSTDTIPKSAPSGSAQYHAGSVTRPSTPIQRPIATLATAGPIMPQSADQAKSRHVAGSPMRSCRRAVQRRSRSGSGR